MQRNFNNDMKTRRFLLLFLILVTFTACTKPVSYGNAEIHISYTANGNPLVMDSLCYTNMAGNQYLVTEIQWFISKITLVGEQGDENELGKVFYIDTNIPESQTLATASIPCKKYIAMRFTFGLDKEDNVTGAFPNPPESNMFWPDPLGGGYHYMKLNGRYLDENGNLAPMNIHLGIGQNEDHTVFYQNYFTVELPLELTLQENVPNVINLDMNLDNWFCNPHLYDITAFGSAIMQNQEAQETLKENGHNVFSIKTNNDMKSPLKTTSELLRKAAPKPHFMTWENIKNTLSNIKESL